MYVDHYVRCHVCEILEVVVVFYPEMDESDSSLFCFSVPITSFTFLQDFKGKTASLMRLVNFRCCTSEERIYCWNYDSSLEIISDSLNQLNEIFINSGLPGYQCTSVPVYQLCSLAAIPLSVISTSM